MISARVFISWLWYALQIKAGYIWGRCGVVWTKAAQDALTKKYNADPTGQAKYKSAVLYGARWIGKVVFDCANLVRWAAKKAGFPNVHSGSNLIFGCDLRASGKLKNGARADGQPLLPGTLVFTGDKTGEHGHVGGYAGNGIVIEDVGTQTGVSTSKITASKWTYWGELKCMNFDVAEGETVPPANPAENAPSAPADNPGDNSPTLPDPAPETPNNGEKPTLRNGDRGDAVKEAQTLLIGKGYSCGKQGADGIFGKNTEAAVRQFQTENGLTADGVIGAATWAALTSEPVEYTVTIPGLSLTHAKALVSNYPGATMTEERGN